MTRVTPVNIPVADYASKDGMLSTDPATVRSFTENFLSALPASQPPSPAVLNVAPGSDIPCVN